MAGGRKGLGMVMDAGFMGRAVMGCLREGVVGRGILPEDRKSRAWSFEKAPCIRGRGVKGQCSVIRSPKALGTKTPLGGPDLE